MNFIQLSPEVCVPERTAILAEEQSGVKKILLLGMNVLQYEDRREIEDSNNHIHPYLKSCEEMRKLRNLYPGEII